MLYESKFDPSRNQLKLTLKPSASVDSISKRHTIYSDRNDWEKTAATPSNVSESGLHHHWQTIEKYYVDRLESLKKEIDMAISQNAKLFLAREELLQEILELQKKSIELTAGPKSTNENGSCFYYPQGVTLEDKPYTPPSPPLNPVHQSNNISTYRTNKPNPSGSITPVIEQNETKLNGAIHSEGIASNNNTTATLAPVTNNQKPGLFRQLSSRLSTRRKKRNEDSMSSNDRIVPTPSTSEPLIHPAAVVSSNRTRLSSLRRTHKRTVFGTDLIQQAQSEKRKTPSIVSNCIREIELRGLTVEGIYRKSGTTTQLRELQNAFNSKKEPDLSVYQDIHTIAGLLKSYLRSLPTPLISNDFILPPTLTDQERLNKLYELLHNLPTETYCTIKHIIQHLQRVHQNQSVNLMTSKNLAVVLGPTLMNLNSMNEDKDQVLKTIEIMILQSHVIFASH